MESEDSLTSFEPCFRRTHLYFHAAQFLFDEFKSRRLLGALQQIHRPHAWRAGEVLGSRVLHVETWNEVEAGFAEYVLHERRAEERPVAREHVVFAAQLRVPHRDERAEQFADRVTGAVGDEVEALTPQRPLL